jgi:hypothetical protein
MKSSRKTSPPRLDLDAVLDCEYEHYPWDDWYRYALACGLHGRLAALGRLLIREAFQHDWPDWLKSACGWCDDGRALLALGLRWPREALRQWDILLRTDGLRGDYRVRGWDWTCGFLGPDAKRLLAALVKAELKTRPPSPSAMARQATRNHAAHS